MGINLDNLLMTALITLIMLGICFDIIKAIFQV